MGMRLARSRRSDGADPSIGRRRPKLAPDSADQRPAGPSLQAWISAKILFVTDGDSFSGRPLDDPPIAFESAETTAGLVFGCDPDLAWRARQDSNLRPTA
jgi:hypothetical protein